MQREIDQTPFKIFKQTPASVTINNRTLAMHRGQQFERSRFSLFPAGHFDQRLYVPCPVFHKYARDLNDIPLDVHRTRREIFRLDEDFLQHMTELMKKSNHVFM